MVRMQYAIPVHDPIHIHNAFEDTTVCLTTDFLKLVLSDESAFGFYSSILVHVVNPVVNPGKLLNLLYLD